MQSRVRSDAAWLCLHGQRQTTNCCQRPLRGDCGCIHITWLASGKSARMSPRGGNSSSTFAVSVRGMDNRLAALPQSAATNKSACHRDETAARCEQTKRNKGRFSTPAVGPAPFKGVQGMCCLSCFAVLKIVLAARSPQPRMGSREQYKQQRKKIVMTAQRQSSGLDHGAMTGRSKVVFCTATLNRPSHRRHQSCGAAAALTLGLDGLDV